MKVLSFTSSVGIAALASSASATVSMNIARVPKGTTTGLKKRHLSERATITESLANNFTGGEYIAQVTVGTPGQTQTLAIDTGSSDVWLLSSTADLCTDPELQDYYGTGGCASTFDSSKSSTFKIVDTDAFDIQYADGSGATGDYITDNLSIGGATIKALEMGVAYNVTLQTGLLGIGYDTNEASLSGQDGEPFIYPSIIDQMMSQGLISTKAYSLYLDDYQASTGSILFGGLDSDKYSGNLLQIPIVPEQLQNGTTGYAEFAVAMSSFSITSGSGTTTSLSTTAIPAIFDSGTTLTYLPNTLVENIYKQLDDAVYDDQSGMAYVACSLRDNNPKMTFNFGFGGTSGINIAVPANELIFDLTGLFSTGSSSTPSIQGISGTPCALGLFPGDSGDSDEESSGPYILGDTFLRSAYVVYDLENNLIALAQTNFNSTTSSIVEFTASMTSIPDVSGVASSAQVTETNTGILGPGDKTSTISSRTTSRTVSSATGTSGTTSSSTGTATGANGAATTSAQNKAGTVPAFDVGGLFVLGVSGVCAVLGATFMLI